MENLSDLWAKIEPVFLAGDAVLITIGIISVMVAVYASFRKRQTAKKKHIERMYEGTITFSDNNMDVIGGTDENPIRELSIGLVGEGRLDDAIPADPLLREMLNTHIRNPSPGKSFVSLADRNMQKVLVNSVANAYLERFAVQNKCARSIENVNERLEKYRKVPYVMGLTFENYPGHMLSRKFRFLVMKEGWLMTQTFPTNNCIVLEPGQRNPPEGSIILQQGHHIGRLETLEEMQHLWSDPKNHELVLVRRDIYIPR